MLLEDTDMALTAVLAGHLGIYLSVAYEAIIRGLLIAHCIGIMDEVFVQAR